MSSTLAIGRKGRIFTYRRAVSFHAPRRLRPCAALSIGTPSACVLINIWIRVVIDIHRFGIRIR